MWLMTSEFIRLPLQRVVKGRGRMTSLVWNAFLESCCLPSTMGGDHKCPVCEATFTRPQHVARHMRSRASLCLCSTCHHLLCFSDTGDRPYKCQFCGDQFARRSAVLYHLAPISQPFVLATFYRDTSTNVTQTKNHYPLPVFVKKGLFQLREPPPQNKSATSVSRRTLLAMAPIHVVGLFSLLSTCSIINLSNPSKMRST